MRVFVGKDADETGQLSFALGHHGKKRIARPLRKPRLPNGGALGVRVMIKVIVGQHRPVRGAPTLSVQLRNGPGVCAFRIAQRNGSWSHRQELPAVAIAASQVIGGRDVGDPHVLCVIVNLGSRP